ncbi:hypothetical protein B7Y94_05425 [Candidatus Saccharibacteria bacterium 32-49-12]|nr:MAG: hypothetical protein B7Y94_05425 [Candidatus Saccharibacteria bacterium 32-49-12]
MKARIDIDTMTFVRFWLVVIGFGLAGVMIYSARAALIIILVAFFLALALSKPVNMLAHRLPNRSRLGGTALAFMSIIVLIGAVIWFVIPPLVEQSAKFAQTLPGLIDSANEQWVGLSEFIDKNNLRDEVDSMILSLKEQSTAWAGRLGANIIDGVGSVASFVVSLFLVLVMSFLMLLEGPAWISRFWGLYKNKDKMKQHKRVAEKMYNVVTGYVTGQLLVSSIGALAAGACAAILSMIFTEVPANLAMPTILLTFILTLIPMFGSTLAGAVVGLLILFNSLPAAIIYVVYFVIYQQIENNFIQPVIQAKKLELSALTVLVSVTIGVYISGILGGIIAVPIAGSIKVLFEEYVSKSDEVREERERPLAKLVNKIRSSTKKA